MSGYYIHMSGYYNTHVRILHTHVRILHTHVWILYVHTSCRTMCLNSYQWLKKLSSYFHCFNVIHLHAGSFLWSLSCQSQSPLLVLVSQTTVAGTCCVCVCDSVTVWQCAWHCFVIPGVSWTSSTCGQMTGWVLVMNSGSSIGQMLDS